MSAPFWVCVLAGVALSAWAWLTLGPEFGLSTVVGSSVGLVITGTIDIYRRHRAAQPTRRPH